MTTLSPDDPRHGTSAGYCAGCHDECCRTAIADYSRHLRARQYLAGGPLTVDALGTKRRIRALMTLGWSGRQIDDRLHRKPTYTANLLCGPDQIHRSTARAVATVYDQLSMRLPEHASDSKPQVIARTRTVARRKGWPPPLAWDDIDDPAENPLLRDTELERWVKWWGARGYVDVDESRVQRILGGEWNLPCTPEEKAEVIARWQGSTYALEAISGWKVDRYAGRRQESAA